MKPSSLERAGFGGRKIAALSLGSLAGFIAGFSLRYGLSLGGMENLHSAFAPSGAPIPATVQMGKNPSFQAAIEVYRSKRPRTTEDRVGMLKTLDLWLSDDPVGCVNSLREMGALSLLNQDVIISAFTHVSEGNPGVQMRMAGEISSPDLRDAVLSAIFKSAIANNPEVALDLLAGLPSHLMPDLQTRLGQAFGKIASPALFTKLLRQHGVWKDLVISGMQVWTKEHTSDALSFLEGIEDASLRQIGCSKTYILEKLESSADPEEMLRYTERLPMSVATTRAMTNALGTLLAENPGRWDELTSRQKSDATTAGIAANAAAKIVVKSPATAALFLSRIPGVEARLEATKQTARQLIWKGNDAEVIAWARSIEDPIVANRIIEEMRFQHRKLPADFKLR